MLPDRHFSLFFLFGLCLIFWTTAPSYAQTASPAPQPAIEHEIVASGLDFPWAVETLPDGGFLITEKPGRLLYVSEDGQTRRAIALPGLDIVARAQGGLLDVTLAPDFETSRLVYLSYAGGGMLGASGTEVARGRFANGANELSNLEIIFKAEPKVRSTLHYGSRLLFGAHDGMLYITLGERYHQMEKAQELDSHHGAVVRLHPDGRIPEDNPFIGLKNALPDIYTYGHRNVQGIAQTPGSDLIWIHEHGPQGGDEMNILEAGANYGWPEVTYGIDYDGSIISRRTTAPEYKNPVTYWDPSIAPCGMAYAAGGFWIGALAGQHLRYVPITGKQVGPQSSFLTDKGWRIRDVHAADDRTLYLVTDEPDGKLVRVRITAAKDATKDATKKEQ